MRITFYTYRAENYCPEHIVPALKVGIAGHGPFDWNLPTEQVLDQVAEANGIDRHDETTFDSDEFPKVVFSTGDDGCECAGCEYVSRCPACGEPIDYCQGHGEIGDPEGYRILQEEIRNSS